MAQWVKCLMSKHEGLISDLKSHMKSRVWSVAVSLAMKTEGRQGLPAQFSGTAHVGLLRNFV